eukprot:TRINITY_DN8496_c0_g1_i1.p1 TRINITY_DN8496_c0_g1~~TRINITY_DN8496_c0_g1_i1.p1  ORF type:complete len:1132 (-),score=279.50 TRINITY_DN8496_c0_g1_i1:39-3434(-)
MENEGEKTRDATVSLPKSPNFMNDSMDSMDKEEEIHDDGEENLNIEEDLKREGSNKDDLSIPVVENNKNGWLWKKGDVGIVLRWTKRWFSLDKKRGILTYSDSPSSPNLKGIIQIDEFTSISESPNSNKKGFQIGNKFKNRIYYLQGFTSEEVCEWMKELNQLVESQIEFVKKKEVPLNFGEISVEIVSFISILTPTGPHTEFILRVKYKSTLVMKGRSYTVSRRFKELLRIHELLIKAIPGVDLPSFPSKMTPLKSQENAAEYRKEGVNKFFATALLLKEVQNFKQLHQFFSMDKEKSMLTITIVSGRHLEKGPLYCALEFHDEKRSFGVGGKTHLIAEENPKWNRTFHFDVTDRMNNLTLELFMDNNISVTKKGYAIIPLSSIPQNQKTEHWFPLHKTKGEVKLRFLYQVYDERNWNEAHKALKESSERLLAKSKESSPPPSPILVQPQKKLLSDQPRMKIRYFYNPPCSEWEGSLYIELMEANKLSRGAETFVILQLDSLEHRTPLVRPSASMSNFAFWFHVKPKTGGQVSVQVYELKRFETSLVVGSAKIELSKLKTQKAVEDIFPIFVRLETPSEQYIPKQLGKALKTKGYQPKLPVIVIPGFASTGLEILQGEPEWLKQRVWFNFSRLSSEHFRRINFNTFGKIKGLRFRPKEKEIINNVSLPNPALGITTASQLTTEEQIEIITTENPTDISSDANAIDAVANSYMITASMSSDTTDEEELTAEEQIFRNRWVHYMSLSLEDGYSDPVGVKVRPIAGKEGIDYLDPDSALSNATYVMGPLFDMLEDLGYSYGHNLLAAPYDWRVPPHILEERDQYFTHLAADIEQLYRNSYGTPVVAIAHSMGNKLFHYFLNWAFRRPELGESWIETRIHTFFSIGAPWVGAPKMVRGVASGENMGLRHLLPYKESKEFIRSFGVTPFLFPMTLQNEEEKIIAYQRGEFASSKYTPLNMTQLLERSGSEKSLEWLNEYFLKDPCFGGEDGKYSVLEAPPGLKRLFCVYGVDVDTEISYYYKNHPTKGLIIDTDAPNNIKGYNTVRGIVYETEDTPQDVLTKENSTNCKRSGDGSVPYSSLCYCKTWKDQIQDLQVHELKNVEHREILSNRILFFLIANLVSDKPKNASELGWSQ